MGPFEAINLDCLSTEPSDYRDASRMLRLYAEYCDDKAMSIKYRMSGEIQAATLYERHAEKLYSQLAAWARW